MTERLEDFIAEGRHGTFTVAKEMVVHFFADPSDVAQPTATVQPTDKITTRAFAARLPAATGANPMTIRSAEFPGEAKA